jgi:hypothetical protein
LHRSDFIIIDRTGFIRFAFRERDWDSAPEIRRVAAHSPGERGLAAPQDEPDQR